MREPPTAAEGPCTARILDLAARRAPTLGAGRLVCIDGPSGSGKTSLAGRLGAPVVHTDDLLEGWSGLPTVHEQVLALLRPLAGGRAGRWRRWDWATGRRAEEHRVEPVPLLVLEGVGAGHSAWAAWTTVLVWVEAPRDVRMSRAVARDGEAIREPLERFVADADRYFAAEAPRARADLLVGT